VAGGLPAVLTRAQRLGFLGPGPIEAHIEHARRLAALIGPAPASFLDLGAGAGVPGLILAEEWPAASGVLLDASRRRGAHLQAACVELEWAGRLRVVVARAEAAARQPEFRGRFACVVARGFGAAAVTAECGVGFVVPGGELVVSEPPGGDPGRWDRAGLAELGLSSPELVVGESVSIARLRRRGPVDERWPRRTGVPARRPLWR
jgi:16S rRNA (guanine527-N7)-methyltransferase